MDLIGERLMRLRGGDAVVLQCPAQTMRNVQATLACQLLAQRGLRLGQPQRIVPPGVIFTAALLLSA